MSMVNTTSEDFFEAKYRADHDPWNFAANRYELRRYERIVAAMEGRSFDLAYEPGCSVGVLTAQLAARCGRVEACDISATAVEEARKRCRTLPNVQVHHASLQAFVPHEADLYVFSEVGYYMTRDALRELMEAHCRALREAATLIACHWRGESADHVLSGDAVHEVLRALPGLTHEREELHEEFRIDRWTKQGVLA